MSDLEAHGQCSKMYWSPGAVTLVLSKSFRDDAPCCEHENCLSQSDSEGRLAL